MGKKMNIYSKILNWASNIRIYWGGLILFGDSHYEVKGKHTRKIIELLQPGDVLLRRYNHYLGSVIIPGYWSHTAIYIGDNNVIHMVGEGITLEDILTFTRCDDIAILRTDNVDLINQAISKANKYLEANLVYDFKFDFKDDSAMSCTEFLNACYGTEGLKLPDDFLNSIFKLIWKKD